MTLKFKKIICVFALITVISIFGINPEESFRHKLLNGIFF